MIGYPTCGDLRLMITARNSSAIQARLSKSVPKLARLRSFVEGRRRDMLRYGAGEQSNPYMALAVWTHTRMIVRFGDLLSQGSSVSQTTCPSHDQLSICAP